MRKIYFFVSGLYYRMKMNLGKGCQLRMHATILNGKYIHLGNKVSLGTGLVLAVYPLFGKKINPVLNNPHGGIRIGDRVSANRNITIYCANEIVIGDDVMLGSDILITDNNHGINPTCGPYYMQPLTTKSTKIGNGCWVGERVCMLAGSEIGDKSIVAAGAIVTDKFPEKCIIGGVPAKILKKWCDDSQSWESVEV